MYELEFLPVARRDIYEIVRYVAQKLQNPTAAQKLAEDLVSAAESLTAFPYANPVFVPLRPLEREYRRLIVRNYLMFYWVEERARRVVVARVIYAARDYLAALSQ